MCIRDRVGRRLAAGERRPRPGVDELAGADGARRGPGAGGRGDGRAAALLWRGDTLDDEGKPC